MTKEQQAKASHNTVQSFIFVGMKFHGLTTMNNEYTDFKLDATLQVNKYFIGL